jgi:hemoglobin
MPRQRLLVKTFLPLLALFLTMSWGAAAAAPAAPAQDKTEKTLYERLGGYDAVALVVDEFIKRLGEDKQLGRFIVGLSTDSKKKLRQHVLNQFCQATGGPCIYTGRDMKTVHTGLSITESDWDVAAKHLAGALDKYRVPTKEKNEVLAFVTSLKKDIVGQ